MVDLKAFLEQTLTLNTDNQCDNCGDRARLHVIGKLKICTKCLNKLEVSCSLTPYEVTI